MSDEKKNLFIARFPYGNVEAPDVTDWFTRTVLEAKKHPRVGAVRFSHYDDTPITMTRNRACRDARDAGCDYLLMVDNDMRPDDNCTGGRTFFLSSLEFMLRHEGPCVVAAPYCGPPPHSPPYVFRWTSGVNLEEQSDPAWRLEMYPREEATMWRGIVEVAAAATGLILIDLKALSEIAPPWFDYEYTDDTEADKATTEDVYFTRNLSLAKVPVYCNFDCWAGHWKRFLVHRPIPIFVDDVRADLAQRIQHGYRKNQILEQVHVDDGVITKGMEANPRIRREKAEGNCNGDHPEFSGVAGHTAG